MIFRAHGLAARAAPWAAADEHNPSVGSARQQARGDQPPEHPPSGVTPLFESLEQRLLLSALPFVDDLSGAHALGDLPAAAEHGQSMKERVNALAAKHAAGELKPGEDMDVQASPVSDGDLPETPGAASFDFDDGHTHTVLAGGNFQAAINAAVAGDVIELEAGATFTGNFILPAHAGTDLITIRSTARAALPNGRVGAVDAPLMPKIVSPNSLPAIRGLFGSSNYLLDGLEIYSTHSLTNNLVLFGYEFGGNGYASTLSEFSDNITIDRSYIHGDSVNSIQHALNINGSNITVSRSEVSEIHGVGFDTQAFLAIFGPGPYTLDNNLLEAAGENILFGGAGPTSSIAALIAANPEFNPQGIAITRNTISKPDRWNDLHPDYDGSNWSVKNLVEFKIGRDIVVAGNFIENVWSDAQDGPAIVITPREASIDNVEIRDNVIRHARYALQANPANHELSNVVIENNLIYQLEYRIFEAVAPTNKQIDNLTIRNNTALFGDNATNGGWGSTNFFTGDTDAAITNLIYQDNILSSGYYGIHGSGQAPGLGTIEHYVIGFDVRGNAIINPYPASANTIYRFNQADYESGGDFYGDFSRYDTIDLVGFDDLTFDDIQDFRVTNNAAIQSAGTGVDIDALLAALDLSVMAPGDFNSDGAIDDLDIDMLYANLGDAAYDLDGDGDADTGDVDVLVHDILDTEYGDINLDGLVNATDLAIMKSHYGAGNTWAQSDLNGSGLADATDLAILKAYFGFERPGGELVASAPIVVGESGAAVAEGSPILVSASIGLRPQPTTLTHSLAEQADVDNSAMAPFVSVAQQRQGTVTTDGAVSQAARMQPTVPFAGTARNAGVLAAGMAGPDLYAFATTRLTTSTPLPVIPDGLSVAASALLALSPHRLAGSRRPSLSVSAPADTDVLFPTTGRSRPACPMPMPSDLQTDLVNILDEAELLATL